MATNLTRLTHKIVIQLHLVAESCTICGSCSRRPVRKLLDTAPYIHAVLGTEIRFWKWMCHNLRWLIAVYL